MMKSSAPQQQPQQQQQQLSNKDIEAVFKKLDVELLENIDSQYFSEPREFRSLIEVLAVLGPKADQIIGTGTAAAEDLLAMLKDRNPAYSKLLNQRQIVQEVIEEVVTLQHGGLNNSVETMSEVVKEYNRGRDEIRGLRKSLHETKAVLTARKTGQIPLKDLWLRKVELEESLRMVKDLELLRSTPSKVQRMMQQKRYLSAVMSLTRAIDSMFSEDLVGVGGLIVVREQIMELKENMLETCVGELREAIIGVSAESLRDGGSDSEDNATIDGRSQSAPSVITTSQYPGEESINNGALHPRAGGSTTVTGGVGGGSSRPPTVAPSMSHSVHDPWSTDFRGIDEAMEVSLPDPSATGGLYIRLLVRAISVLQLEEDVERMILDTVGKAFQVSTMRRIREAATSRQSHVASKLKKTWSDEEDFALQTKLFTGFVSSMLNTGLLSLKRLLYVLRLLHLSKVQRNAALHQQQMIANNSGAVSVSNSSIGGSSLATGAFSPVGRLRNDSHGTLLSSPWGGGGPGSTAATIGTGTSGGSGKAEAGRKVKDNLRPLVVRVWLEIQDTIVQQIKAHLVEPDVQDISDQQVVSPSSKGEANVAEDDDDDDDLTASLPVRGNHERRVSISAAFLNTSEGMKTDNVTSRAGRLGSYSTDGDNETSVSLLFRPSARHAAPLYRRVVLFQQLVVRMMKENGITDSRLLPSNIDAGVGDNNSGWKTIGEDGYYSPNQRAAQRKKASGTSRKNVLLVEFIQSFLEAELIPVIQSTVNHVMRDIQMNNEYFGIIRTSADEAAAPAAASEDNTSSNSNAGGISNDLQLCQAAELCCTASKPLFSYWLQLSEHRSMVCTVLDRLIRGYAAAASDELESISYTWLSAEKPILHAVLKATKTDPLFQSYRSAVYGLNKLEAEDLFAGAGTSVTTTATVGIGAVEGRRSVLGGAGQGLQGKRQALGISAQQAQQQHYETQESEVWGTYWNIDDLEYPISSQSITRDMKAIATVTSIAHGCDWLVKKMSSFTTITLKKLNASNAAPKQRGSFSAEGTGINSGTGNLRTGGGTKGSKHDVQDSKAALLASVAPGCRQLAKIAEEGYALLRGELQIVCFYFMYRVAHIQYNGPGAGAGGAVTSPLTPSTNGSGGGVNNAAVSRNKSGNLYRPSSNFSISAVSRTSTVAAGRGEESMAGRGMMEEEAILASFSTHLSKFFDTVLNAAPPDALAIIFSPLCLLVPKLLVRCAMTMAVESSANATLQRKQLLEQASITKNQLDQLQSMAGSIYTLSHLTEKQQKAFLLRIVVVVQQNIALHIQALPFLPETKRTLLDKLTEGFEHCRRFITLFGMPSGELKAYFAKNPMEYGKEESQVLWQKCSERSEEFDEIWAGVLKARDELARETARSALAGRSKG